VPLHHEIELKWAVDADGHRQLGMRLAGLLGPPRLLAQRNRFFDTADRRLRAAGRNLRLRDEGGRTLLTLKRRLPDDLTRPHDLHRHEEWEQWLDAQGDALPLVGDLPLSAEVRALLAGSALELVGGFVNRRAEFHAGADLLCLDESDFLGRRTDYELEIETSDPASAARRWTSQLADWGIVKRAQPLTKFARLLALIGDQEIPPAAPPKGG